MGRYWDVLGVEVCGTERTTCLSVPSGAILLGLIESRAGTFYSTKQLQQCSKKMLPNCGQAMCVRAAFLLTGHSLHPMTEVALINLLFTLGGIDFLASLASLPGLAKLPDSNVQIRGMGLRLM